MRIFILAVLLFSIPLKCFGNESQPPLQGEVYVGSVEVSNIGSVFSVKYELLLGENVKSCNVKLVLSLDGGRTYSFVPDVRNLKGDVGKIKEEGLKHIEYDIFEDKRTLVDKDIVFKVEVTGKDVIKTETLVAANMSVMPQLSYGIMAGMVRKVGGYVKFRSDFSFPSSNLSCTKDGRTSDGGTIWTDGGKCKSRLVATGGVMFRAVKWLYPYLGAGYGYRNVFWREYTGDWVKVSDYSVSGVSLDAGAVFKIGKFALSAGVTNTAFKYTEVEVGIGVVF